MKDAMEACASMARLAAVALLGLGISAGAASADLLADIKKKGVFTAGTEARYAPFEFVEDGKIVGYSQDIMDLIMAHPEMAGVKLDRLDLPWQGILPGLEAKRFDYVVTAVTATPERIERYHMSVPIADATMAILKRADDATIATPMDIAGKTIGSQTGSAQLDELNVLAAKLAEAGTPVAGIRDYVDYTEAYADLATGRIDAVANSLPNLLEAARTRPDVFAVAEGTFGPPKMFGWAARKDAESASLAAFIDARLIELNESGKLGELQVKWFGKDMKLPTALPPLTQ